MADAQVTVGADASAVEEAAKKAKEAWAEVGGDIVRSIGTAAASVVRDMAGIVTAQGKISFASQHQQVRDFEAATARLATASGRDMETVRRETEATGVAIGKRPQEVAAWTSEVGKLSYNFQGAEKSIRGFSALAAETGRSTDDYRGLAVEVAQLGHVSGDSSNMLGSLAAQAKAMGNEGGLAAFADQVTALSDTISHFATKSPEDFKKITALTGVLGKGLNPQAAGRVQQTALGALSDTVTWERYLGHKITNEHGQVKDPTQALSEIVGKIKRVYGKDAERRLQIQFGAETGSALSHADFGQVGKLAALAPSGDLKKAQDNLNGSDYGSRAVAEAELAKSSRELFGSATALGRAADSLQKFAANHPVASTAATGIATGVAGALAGGVGKSIMAAVKEVGVGNAVKALPGGATALGWGAKAVGALSTVAAPLAIGAAVAGAGAYGIKKFESAQDERFKLYDKAIDSASSGALNNKVVAIRRTNAAVHGAQGLTPAEQSAATNAASKVVGSKDAMAAIQFSHGGGDAMKSLIAALNSQNKDMDAGEAEKIAKAIAAALQGLTLHVENASDTPVTAVTKSGHSHAAGQQHTG